MKKFRKIIYTLVAFTIFANGTTIFVLDGNIIKELLHKNEKID